MNPSELIYEFNSQAKLLQQGYHDELESSFQIEEALEGLSDLSVLASVFRTEKYTPKHLSRLIANTAHNISKPLTDVERLDKACDAIVFAYGSIYKLGLTPEQARRALIAVCNANLQKLHMPKDSHGKLTKPANFIGPEEVLQQILEER